MARGKDRGRLATGECRGAGLVGGVVAASLQGGPCRFRIDQAVAALQAARYSINGEATCEAFPQGIPKDVFAGEVSHLDPIQGFREERPLGHASTREKPELVYHRIIFKDCPFDQLTCQGQIG